MDGDRPHVRDQQAGRPAALRSGDDDRGRGLAGTLDTRRPAGARQRRRGGTGARPRLRRYGACARSRSRAQRAASPPRCSETSASRRDRLLATASPEPWTRRPPAPAMPAAHAPAQAGAGAQPAHRRRTRRATRGHRAPACGDRGRPRLDGGRDAASPERDAGRGPCRARGADGRGASAPGRHAPPAPAICSARVAERGSRPRHLALRCRSSSRRRGRSRRRRAAS